MVVVEYTSAYWRTHGLSGIKPIVINCVVYVRIYKVKLQGGAPAPVEPMLLTPLYTV